MDVPLKKNSIEELNGIRSMTERETNDCQVQFILLVTTFGEGVVELEIAAVSRLVSMGILVIALGVRALARGSPQ